MRPMLAALCVATVSITSCNATEVQAVADHYGIAISADQAEQVASYYHSQPDEAAAVIDELSRPCDVECMIRRAWPDNTEDRAVRVARCESKLDPTAANKRTSARGLFQIMISVHRARIRRLGFTEQQVATQPLPNIAVALDIYQDSGFSPWVCKG